MIGSLLKMGVRVALVGLAVRLYKAKTAKTRIDGSMPATHPR